MKQPIKMTPGDELHLTALMAPFSLNLVTGKDRQHLLGYGRAAFEAGKAGQCLHQIQEPEADIWPCVNIDVDENGKITNAKLYSPGLPAGNHDVYPVRVPYMDEHTEAWRACVDELEKAVPGFMSLGNMNGIECAVAAIRGLSERAKHQEPAAAEQAAWHAGLYEGRAQAGTIQRAMVRYCPECGHIGEVRAGHRDCCPDGSQAFMVPEKHAGGLRTGFLAQIAQAAPAAVAVPDERAAFEAKFRHLDLSQKPDAWGHARYSHDAISLAWEAWQARAPLAATPAAPVAEDVRHRNGVRKLQAASASQARKDGVDAGDALYALAVKHGASKTEAAGFAHHINGAFALLEGQVHDGLSRETARDSATPTAAAPVVLPAGRLSGAEMIEALEWRRQAELEAISASPAAAAPVVLPEPDAVISEVMGLVDEWGMESHLRGEAELDAQHSEATQEEIDCAKDRASKERAAWNAIESKLRALLATATGLPAQAVADEVHCVCGASWLRHGANDYEMTDTPRKARASGDANG